MSLLINLTPMLTTSKESIAENISFTQFEIESIEKILNSHNIDAVLPTMGGQTALNLCIKNVMKWVCGMNIMLKYLS